MAVNTRNRRFGMMAMGDVGSIGPAPDGSFASVADRLQLLQLYPGIAADEPVPDPPTSYPSRNWLAQMRRRRRR